MTLQAAGEMNTMPKTVLDVHFGEIRSDLAQLDTVLDDAIAMLFASFTNIAGLVRLEQKLAAQLALAHETRRTLVLEAEGSQLEPHADTPVSLLLAQHAVLADQIETQISAAVRSLQFQDLCSQILSHAGSRVSALELTLAGVDADEAPAPAAGGDDGGKVSAEVIEFPRTRPVVQQGMQVGEIELF